MASHTPGPWRPMKDGPNPNRGPWEPWTANMEAAPGLTIASPKNTEPICRVSGYLQPVLSNARLICAAPALLEALEWILKARKQGHYTVDIENKARAAIKLARGEA